MCGFIGVFGNQIFSEKLIKDSLDMITYRGPDNKKIYFDENFKSGFCRLSIQDLSNNANQPMVYDDLILLFNGEIYNFQELKKLLIDNYDFKTNSDTEVLIKGFHFFGEDFFKMINGMFSICIYNKTKQEICLFRDHIGKKPLYYSFIDSTLVFASEIKQFKSFINFKINKKELTEYILYKSLIGEQTLINNIHQVQNSEMIKIRFLKKRFSISKKNIFLESKQEGEDIKLNYFINQSLDKRLIADVPIGIFLSGGLDSSLITAMVRNKFPNKVLHTFSINFLDDNYSEKKTQKIVSELFNTEHHSIDFDSNDFINYYEKAIYLLDYPLIHPSSVALLKLSELAKNYVTVLLSGEGSDEIFSGYPKYKFLKYKYLLNILFKLNPIFHNLLPNFGKSKILKENSTDKTKNFNEFFSYSRLNHFIKNYFLEKDAHLFGLEKRTKFLESNNKSEINKLDQITSLEVLLRRLDRMTMGNSIEARAPFCDENLRLFANNLKQNEKFDGKETKKILKRYAEKFLPKEIIYQKKIGFVAPWVNWYLDNKKFNNFVNDNLFTNLNYCSEIIDTHKIKTLINNNVNQSDIENVIFPVFNFVMWSKLNLN